MIPVNTPLLTDSDKAAVLQCFDTGWISSEGPLVGEFENKFSNYIGRQYGIAVSNGSAALDIAVKAIGIDTGDEVIMPTFTIISPAFSVIRQGGVPVLVDADPFTWNMRVEDIEAKITTKTKCIIVVHIYGLPVDMDPVLDLAKKYRLKLIEDAAEMHGQEYNGRKCGTFGDLSIFSFYPNKHITTGEGGMILTDDKELFNKCAKYRNLAFEPEKRRFVHEELGWNYRMTSLQAALGISQLNRIKEIIDKKRWIGKTYNNLLSSLKNFELPVEHTVYAKNIYWVYGLVAKDEEMANKCVKFLSENKVGTRPFFWCMHEQPIFERMGLVDKNLVFPNGEHIARNGFYIPSGLALTEAEINLVGTLLLEFDRSNSL